MLTAKLICINFIFFTLSNYHSSSVPDKHVALRVTDLWSHTYLKKAQWILVHSRVCSQCVLGLPPEDMTMVRILCFCQKSRGINPSEHTVKICP